MNIHLQDNSTPNARFPFELNQRVRHAEYGDGIIRGMVNYGTHIRWLVQFDSEPLLTVPELYAASPDTLQAIADER